MTKVHGKRYAYKFDFGGLAQAIQPASADPVGYKYQHEMFMSGYPGQPKLNFMPHAPIATTPGPGLFGAPSPYWPSSTAGIFPSMSNHVMSHHTGGHLAHAGTYYP